MQKKTNTFFAGIGLIVVSILVSCSLSTEFASAFSTSITTASSILLDATFNGDSTSIRSESINIQSDCRAGYNLTIVTPEGSDLYKYENDAQSSNTASFTAVDGTSALNSSNNTNKWGYTLTSNPTSGTVFSPLSITPSVLKTSAETASSGSDINDTFSIHYGIKADGTIEPGIYQMADDGSGNAGSIVYQLTMEPTCLLYTVQYQDNGADNPNGMGTTDASTGEKSVKQTNIDEDTKITLLAPNFKKSGYSFLGWSTDQNAYAHFIDNDNTNDPIVYGPMEDVVIDSTIIATSNNRNQINMYAVWIPALKDGNDDPVYMQEWDNPNTNLPHDGCSTLTATVFDDTVTDEKGKIQVVKDSVVALTDKRDNEVYTVARLADGNCWMTENLRLEAAGTMGQNINDLSVTNQSLSQGYGGTTGTYGNFAWLATSESANFTISTTANDIYKSDGSGDIFNSVDNTLEDIGTSNYPSYRFPRYNDSNNSDALSSPTYIENYVGSFAGPFVSGSYKDSTVSAYGNYYTWAAVMANTNHYTSLSTSESAGTSICPTGWHLPSSGNSSREYGSLSQEYGGTGNNQSSTGSGDIISNRFRTFPNNFLYSGSFSGSSASIRGSYGGYWSRSANDYWSSYRLYLYHNDLSPSYNNDKYSGYSARCLSGSSDIEITLDSNNGTGAVSRVYGVAGSSTTLPTVNSTYGTQPSIAQPNYSFKNWNTSPDGSGTSYTSSYSIPAGSTGITLYAQWYPQYIVTYVNNCMSWASSDTNCNATTSANTSIQKINLNTSGNGSGILGAYDNFALTGWKIKEWTTNADGTGTAYPVSSTYNVTGANAGDGITLYAHWTPIYSVQYDGNGSDNDSTGMGSTDVTTGIKTVRHTNVAEGDTFDLFASNFKKAGYGFVGWSTDANAWNKLTDNDTTNDAKIWGPNETIAAPAYNGTPIITLYAIWAPAEKIDPSDSSSTPVYLQNWTGCSAMTATSYDNNTSTLTVAKNSITALTDQRDNQTYAIAKLADGNCWMIENLRLSTAGTVGNNINDSSITNQSLAEGYGGVFTGLADAESTNFSNTNANTLYSTTNITGSYPYFRFPRYNESNKTANITPSQTQSVTSTNAHVGFNKNIYSYGNYYTWAAAIADTTDYEALDSHTDVATSICPHGWHLPYGDTGSSGTNIGNTSGGFYYLANRMAATASNTVNSNKFRTFPNNLVYAGMYTGGSSTYDRGNGAYYWSTSARSAGNAHNLNLSNTRVSPGNDGSYVKYNGSSVRCIASPTS